MQVFDSDGVPIAFIDEGEGPPTLLIHGFASNHRVNWVSTSWLKDLLAAGRRVVAFDNRGHGESGKLYKPEVYRPSIMAADARRLLDHLGIGQADVVGYSMGGRIAAFLAIEHRERVRRLALGGLGEGLLREIGPPPDQIADALLTAAPEEIADARVRLFRTFADQTGSDRRALAACILGCRHSPTATELGRISAPVLVVVGGEDEVAGRAEPLADLIPGAEAVTISGRDHMKTVGDRRHKAAVLAFLQRQS